MSYIILGSAKILTLAIALVLFISVGIICEFALLPDCAFYCPLKKNRCTLLFEGTGKCTNLAPHSGSTFVCHHITMLR